ncbi:MAG: ATP-binding cassette domain-containing protein [Clostridiales Family XIII bacterium]|jgi:energy-coupling factor transport system ATP-binding protein|nr:ATP-binding cassette domain-containing protein [Clostridiales Family XIII bacterium]
MEIFALEHLTFTYPGRETPALDGIDLSVEKGAFVVLCGPSGCGKTTLLRHLKPELTPHGTTGGRIRFEGKSLKDFNRRDTSARIGFVMQSPENQIVTDKVWHELAFGLESLGCDTPSIRLRVAEMASFFGMQTWFHKSVFELSGGQKQLLALASVMAMQPSALILDEPTSQLDPIAAVEFLGTVGRINRELGVTIFLTEHRLEEAFPLASRAIVMDGGRVIADGAPGTVGAALRASGHGMFRAMPVPMRVWFAVGSELPCPMNARDGRVWIDAVTADDPRGQGMTGNGADPVPDAGAQPAVALDEVWFRYGKALPDVVRGLSLRAYPGEVYAILGGNGTGKTTALSLIAGLNKPYRGKVCLAGEEIGAIARARLFDKLLAVLPQNPQTIFTRKTVGADLAEILSERKLSKREKEEKVRRVAALCGLGGLLASHPYDLSGGEQQRAALAKILLLEPKILLLDEPTKGLDAEFKAAVAAILHSLAEAGATVIMVSHDIEFCAEYADRCALFFDGGIVTEGTPERFFSGNSFYTSAANRMARHRFPSAITADDVIAALGAARTDGAAQESGAARAGGAMRRNDATCANDATRESKPAGTDGLADGVARTDGADAARCRVRCADVRGDDAAHEEEPGSKAYAFSRFSPARRTVAVLSFTALIAAIFLALLHFEGLKAFISGGDAAVGAASDAGAVWKYVGILWALAMSSGALVGAFSWKRRDREFLRQTPPGERKLPARTVAAALMILIAAPLTVCIGVFFLGDRKYYFVSLLILLETMLPFALIFEGRKPQAREIVIIAVLCAIAAASRVAFFMLPQFKPVVAFVIVAGVAFGGEAGFLTGAMSAFVSNMFLGQGPWTPWQMFALGIIGFLAGTLFQKGVLLRDRGALAVFGALAAFLIYGGIMNSAMVLMYQSNPTAGMFLASLLQGVPFDLVHALATVIFLFVIARPMLEKLDRVKTKYGLAERARDAG